MGMELHVEQSLIFFQFRKSLRSDDEEVAVLIKVIIYKTLGKSHKATAVSDSKGGRAFIRIRDSVWTRRWRNRSKSIHRR